MSDLAQRLFALSYPKRALLMQRLREYSGGALRRRIAAQPRGERNTFPVSFSQQRLWFLDQWEPGSPAYNLSGVIRLTGPLDRGALESSLRAIIQRHEVLRTTFADVDGQPVQVIAPMAELSLPVLDLSGYVDPESEVQRLALEDARRPFDLAAGPLLRAQLLRCGETDHVLILTMHHIISDGWSTEILMRELAALYGGAVTLPELPIQFADFAVWQRQWLESDGLADQVAYWTQQLHDAPPVLALPTDRPRPAEPGFAGAIHTDDLDVPLSEALRTLARDAGTTLFVLLLTAFKVLLAQRSGQRDIVVGAPISGRNQPETQGLIGFFVNTLVLRTNLAESSTFPEALNQVRQVALGAFAHQDLPFDKLVQVLQPQRRQGYSPLFQVWFVLNGVPQPSADLRGLKVEPLEIDNGKVRHDLKLGVLDRAEGLKLVFEYRTELWERDSIRTLSEDLQQILTAITRQPDVPLEQLFGDLNAAQSMRKAAREEMAAGAGLLKLRQARRKEIPTNSGGKG